LTTLTTSVYLCNEIDLRQNVKLRHLEIGNLWHVDPGRGTLVAGAFYLVPEVLSRLPRGVTCIIFPFWCNNASSVPHAQDRFVHAIDSCLQNPQFPHLKSIKFCAQNDLNLEAISLLRTLFPQCEKRQILSFVARPEDRGSIHLTS